MNTSKCLLTLVVPRHLEDIIVPHLLSFTSMVDSVTIETCELQGNGLNLVTALENVKGRAHCSTLRMLVHLMDFIKIIEQLRSSFSTNEISYYVLPIMDEGTLGHN